MSTLLPPHPKMLAPPFDKKYEILPEEDSTISPTHYITASQTTTPHNHKRIHIHPASLLHYHTEPGKNMGHHTILRPSKDAQSFREYLKSQLLTPKLDRIHSRLWLAGLPRPARPLHRQKLLQRNINITESPNEHLVWKEDQIYIKPLPAWLLDHSFWEAHLGGTPPPTANGNAYSTDRTASPSAAPRALHASAVGFLLSYTWLLSYPSDLRIAHAHHLVPAALTWPAWVALASSVLDRTADASARYRYGELRLPRLTLVYWITPSAATAHDLVFGYMSRSTWYKDFFARNFAWLAVIFVYVTVVLSAMQVGLATEGLAGDGGFQRVSYGVAVAAMVGVAGMVGCIVVVWTGLFLFHFLSTVEYVNRVEKGRRVEEGMRRDEEV